MAGIYINQQIVKTTAEWAGDSTVYPANILLFEKLESGKFSIAVTDGVNTFANLNKVATDIDAYSKTESDERYPQKEEVNEYMKIPADLWEAVDYASNNATVNDSQLATLESYVPIGSAKTYLKNNTSVSLGVEIVNLSNSESWFAIKRIYIGDTNSWDNIRYVVQINKSNLASSTNLYTDSLFPTSENMRLSAVRRNNNRLMYGYTIDLKTKGDGTMFLSDDGEYKEIESRLPYFFNPSALSGLSTNSSYSAESITSMLGMTLREFVANYGERIVFKGYMGALNYSQDNAGTLAEFTFYKDGAIYVVKIIHEDADTTCNVTVTEKQLVTNIVAISESNYATTSKDSSTLYLVY